jgi:hypothetical protein
VYEVESGEMVGSAYDITFRGIRLVANRMFTPGTVYRLRLLLPEDSFFGESVELDAQCKHCHGVSETNSYDCGFAFREKAGPAITPLTSLLKDLEKHGRLAEGNGESG